jgi:phage repressor protein C with HTH and peptisase S24 domain
MNIGDRLKQWRVHKNLKQDEASALLGVPFSTYQKYEMGVSKPGTDAMEKFAHAGINTNWLLTGEGDMMLPGGLSQQEPETKTMSMQQTLEMLQEIQEAKNQGDKERIRRRYLDIFDDEVRKPAPLGHSEQAYNDRMGESAASLDDFALVPFYDVEASAGHGSHVGEEIMKSQLAFKKDWLLKKGLQIGKCALITARGDSMEPTISHGDILLVDTSIESIKDDAIYIVQSDHHLIVKRIQQSMDGSLTIISDNMRYKDQMVSPDQAKEIKIAGRVRWYGHEI